MQSDFEDEEIFCEKYEIERLENKLILRFISCSSSFVICKDLHKICCY